MGVLLWIHIYIYLSNNFSTASFKLDLSIALFNLMCTASFKVRLKNKPFQGILLILFWEGFTSKALLNTENEKTEALEP